MKIYTKTGDSGETSLLGGKRVKKDCLEMAAIGEVDELNGAIGVLVAGLPEQFLGVKSRLQGVQHILFVIGANLAAAQTELIGVPPLAGSSVSGLEAWIDEMDAELPELTQFILPGGSPSAAQSFLARAVCRRAERQVVALSQIVKLSPILVTYLNRLSDVLFVLGRWVNFQENISDIEWQKVQ
ncbi:MAG: ATP:cob(I)alamin adenosyltransferase [Candidatus Magasanikbacteria bacterium GW2011_GWA2_56_11]|uniref:Corrinoid adenosyltransferase n=1 Tax=Candidatus Magasanikbacteria bacterium GW2011_GWA2_56_11 TaxID=1619044 RepID=A0A0G1YI19_9BACT|nr:MAG: ATP:cob(I)alamin adenosyltransferase [Candidatus Magasanikbacteria bacterium GW2011_GWA2_56_11]